MFSVTSRYRNVETAVLSREGQPPLPYLRRRFLPPLDAMAASGAHVVRQGDRLDNVTAFYLGDPTLFWSVCDANVVLRPDDLTAQPGRVVNIPTPGTI